MMKSLLRVVVPELAQGGATGENAWKQKLLVFAVAAALFAATLIAYRPAMQASFIWDDDDYVTENQALRSVEGLGKIWFELGTTPQYYPLVHTSFWIEYHLWNLNPIGFHVVNVVLHALSALLLWALLRRLAVPGALLAAAVFALHPIGVESVAWVTERKNVLSLFLYLASALVYLEFLALTARRSDDGADSEAFPPRSALPPDSYFVVYLAALLLFAGALLSKTVTSSLPAAILLLIWWKRGRLSLRDVLPLLPFFALGAGAGMITSWMEKVRVGAQGKDWDFSLVERTLIAGRALWFYAGKIFLPTRLAFIYPRWQVSTAAWWQYLFPAAALAAFAALWATRKRLGRGPLCASLFFAGTLFPALGFFNVFPMRYSFVADHFQYHASLGLVVLFAAGLTRAAQRNPRAALVPLLGATLLLPAGLGAITFSQSRHYRDYATIWKDTVDKNPNSVLALTCLASALVDRGEVPEAIRCYEKALKIDPMDDLANFNLGKILHGQGKTQEAIGYFWKSITANPRCAHCYYFLAVSLAEQEKLPESLAYFRRAVRLNPQDPYGHYNYALTLHRMGKLDEAATQYRAALKVQPEWPEAHLRLGDALVPQNKLDDAAKEFREALRLKPDLPEIKERLEALRQMMQKQG